MNAQEAAPTTKGGIPPLATTGTPITMSSREIAELCGKEHSNVIRDIRGMLVNLYGDDYVAKNMPEHYRNRHSEYIRENADAILNAIMGDDSNWKDGAGGRTFRWERDKRGYISAFFLPKDLTLTLVAGYNVKLRKRIIDRWIVLEEQAAKGFLPDFSDPVKAARAWADAMEQRQLAEKEVLALEAQAKIDRPKVAFADAVDASEDTISVGDLAKLLRQNGMDIGQNRLFKLMHKPEHGYLMKSKAGPNVPTQKSIDLGLFEMKEWNIRNPRGKDKIRLTPRVTGKGQQYFINKFQSQFKRRPAEQGKLTE